jgi:Ca-activated chloride channel family protein
MFELTLPWVLIALPLPLLLWFLLPSAAKQLPRALKVPFFNDMMANIQSKHISHDTSTQIVIPLIIWSLLLLAFSGPRWVGEPRPLKREGHNIMLALDLSGSMELDDMRMQGQPATRLEVVKRAASQFVADRTNDKIGLILFGTQAYLQTPLTYDHQNVLNRIADATVGLAGKTTSIGDALGLAVKRLQKVPSQGRVIILLTDGVNNSGVLTPIKAAELANDSKIKIYTIGLGVENQNTQLANNLFLNLNTGAELDEDTLKEVANITHGRYFRASDTQSLQAVYQTINQMETVSNDNKVVRPQHDYYTWPLALAFFIFLYWFTRGKGARNAR